MRPKIQTLLCLAALLSSAAAFAGQDPTAAPDGTEAAEVEIHQVVSKCAEEDEECREETVRKIVIGGDGLLEGWPHRLRFDGDGHFVAGIHHGFDGAFLGVQLTDLTPELRRHFGVPEDAGVMISSVVEESPAFRAGLQAGDIITGVSGSEVGSSRGLSAEIGRREEGETVDLEVWREGRLEQISATLERREDRGMMFHRIHLGDCDEGDCGAHLVDFTRCPGNAPCRVEVRCEDGGCTCTVDGEPTDCEGLHGAAHPED